MPETRPRNRRSYDFVPLTMTWAEVAATVFRSSESWLRDHITEYVGFPMPDRSLDVFSREAVEAWVRARFGLAPAMQVDHAAEGILLGRIHAKPPRALSGR